MNDTFSYPDFWKDDLLKKMNTTFSRIDFMKGIGMGAAVLAGVLAYSTLENFLPNTQTSKAYAADTSVSSKNFKEFDLKKIDEIGNYYIKEVYLLDPNKEYQKVRQMLEISVAELEQYDLMNNLDKMNEEQIKRISAIFHHYGLAMKYSGKFDEAMNYYSLANNIRPSAKTYTNMGLLYAQVYKDYEKAIVYYNKALTIEPDSYVAKIYKQKALKELNASK